MKNSQTPPSVRCPVGNPQQSVFSRFKEPVASLALAHLMRRLAVLIMAILCLSPHIGLAIPYAWNAGTTWVTPGNWLPGGPPLAGDDANFFGGGTGFVELNNGGAGHSVLTVEFNAATPNYYLQDDYNFFTSFTDLLNVGASITKNGLNTVTLASMLITCPTLTVNSGAFDMIGTNVATFNTVNLNGGIVCVTGFFPSIITAANWNVNSGATLKGTGLATTTPGGYATIIGNVNVAAGGTLLAGCSPGTFNIQGNVAFAAGSQSVFELAVPNVVGGGSDLFNIDGDLTLNGTFDVVAVAGFGSGTYRLINYAGAFVNNGIALGSLPVGYAAQLDFSMTNQVNLIIVQQPIFSTYGGLQLEVVGDAVLNFHSNLLTISNIGTQGQDGVKFDARLGLNLQWQDVTTTNLWPAETYFEWQFLNSGDSAVGKLRTQQNGSEMDMIADYSPVGVTNYFLMFYSQGVLLTNRLVNVVGNAPTVLWKTSPSGNGGGGNGGNDGGGGGSTDIHVQSGFCDQNGFYVPGYVVRQVCPCEELVAWPENTGPMPCEYQLVTYTGTEGIHVSGVTGIVDAVVLAASGTTSIPQFDKLQLVASGVPSFTFTDASINPFGLPLHALGQAEFTVTTNRRPIIRNIGSSGQDGVSMTLGGVAATRIAIAMETNPIPVGAIIAGQGKGTVNGVNNQPLQSVAFHQTSTNVMITSDFTSLGAAMQSVEIRSNGVPVHNSTNNAASMKVYVDGMEVFGSWWLWGLDIERIDIYWGNHFTNLYNFSLPNAGGGITTALGNQLVFRAINGTNVVTGGLTSLAVTGSGIPSFTIDSEVNTPLPAELHARLTLNNLVITWSGGGVLQQSSDLVVWSDIPSARSPHSAPLNSPRKFFRVRSN